MLGHLHSLVQVQLGPLGLVREQQVQLVLLDPVEFESRRQLLGHRQRFRKLLLGGEHDAVDGGVLLLATDHRVQEPFERRSVEGPQQSRHFLPAKRDDLHRQLVVAVLERDGEDVVAQVRCPGVLRQRQLLVVGRAADLDEDVGSDAEERVRQIVLVQRFQIGLKRIGSNFTLISSILRSRYSVILPKLKE